MQHVFSSFTLWTICVLSFMSSCINKETPIPLKSQGEATVAQVSMSETYSRQIYYSLRNNTQVGSNDFSSWDLGFETSASGWHTVLNGAKFMKVYPVVGKTFSDVNLADTAGIRALFDMPSGSLDSTAFGDWRDSQPVYIVHRGTDASANFQGMSKIQILSVDAQEYLVRLANIDGTGEKELPILKDDQYNYTFLSFADGGKTLLVEPPKAQWDVVFTKYTHYYYDLDMEYSVVGCLLNTYNTYAVLDSSDKTFESIDLQSVSVLPLSSFINTIGFDWKTFDFSTNRYTVNSGLHYVIRSSDEAYYKLRFLDFYESGVKGSPQFEFQRL